MRESRNGLRPVTVTTRGKEIKGYLLYIGQEGNINDGIGIYAYVELEDGGVSGYDLCNLKFDDVVNL